MYETFFREQDKNVNKLIDNLMDFRIDFKIEQKNDIKDLFIKIKDNASILEHNDLSKICEYYEKYIDRSRHIDRNSHEFFSKILEGIGAIKRDIKQLQANIGDEKLNYQNMELNQTLDNKKGNILLLDDDKLISAILKNEFQKEGYNLMATADHEEAIEHILYKDINVALIDVVMPKVDGFEVFEILKESGVDIPIIFLSGKSMIDYKVEALSKGVDDYITKPFEIKEVIARVERSLGRANQYKDKVNKDKLTSAYTKEFFNKKVLSIINSKKHLKDVYCVAFIDLDDFKFINDNYGHIIGDYVLIDFVKFLKSNLEETDNVFRFGGDEFIVLFSGKTIKDVYDELEVFRRNLVEAIFEYKDIEDEIKLKVSMGVTCIKEDDNIETLLKRADKYLYKSKSLGKNTIVCSEDIE